jgi:hypothetical protein
MDSNMEKFYIFLDIDGVLTNYEHIYYAFEALHLRNVYEKFDERNVAALNYMISRLSEEYEVVLVISSTLRGHLTELVAQFKEEGLKYEGKIFATPFFGGNRGAEIQDFYYKHDVKNYIIIDDDICDIEPYFTSSHIIHTSYSTGGLSFQKVRAFLETINPEWIKPRF